MVLAVKTALGVTPAIPADLTACQRFLFLLFNEKFPELGRLQIRIKNRWEEPTSARDSYLVHTNNPSDL